jgi:hypothetical protein
MLGAGHIIKNNVFQSLNGTNAVYFRSGQRKAGRAPASNILFENNKILDFQGKRAILLGWGDDWPLKVNNVTFNRNVIQAGDSADHLIRLEVADEKSLTWQDNWLDKGKLSEAFTYFNSPPSGQTQTAYTRNQELIAPVTESDVGPRWTSKKIVSEQLEPPSGLRIID